MEFMRQQAVNFGTRILTEDVVRSNLKRHPFVLTGHPDEEGPRRPWRP